VSQVNVQIYIYFFKLMKVLYLLICLLRVVDPAMLKRKRQKLSSESELLRQLQCGDPSE